MLTRRELMEVLDDGKGTGASAALWVASFAALVVQDGDEALKKIDILTHDQCLTLCNILQHVEEITESLTTLAAKRHAQVCDKVHQYGAALVFASDDEPSPVVKMIIDALTGRNQP